MKKIFIFLSMFLGMLSYSQTKCVTDEITDQLIQSDPNAKLKKDNLDDYLANNIVYRTMSNPYTTIPVVVYVVHNNQPLGTGANINDSQVLDQIAALNTYFNSYGLNFCLATKRMGTETIPTNGGIQNTPGIIHYNSTYANHTANATGRQQLLSLVNNALIPPTRYMKIWVVNTINSSSGNVLGYATFPNLSADLDGIVMRYDGFGNGTPNLLANYNLGKALVHEIGHYLGLYHTFEGGCAGMTSSNCMTSGDKVCDTPPVAAANFSCITGTNSCSETPNAVDLINNYMDYGDNNCANSFTTGQKNRMLDILYTSRQDLITDENLIFTGVTCVNPSAVTAKFTPSAYYACFSGNNITFNPMMVSGSLSYSWDFGDPASGSSNTSNATSPSHAFSSVNGGNPYTVTLNVTDGTNSASYICSIYLTNCSAINTPDKKWYFAMSNALDFSSGVPVPIAKTFPYEYFYKESVAQQNDSSNNVLFYTNGQYVYRDISTTNVNSSSLLGDSSSKAGTLILPNPANSSQYYVFTKDSFFQCDYCAPTVGKNGFRYSLVNVSGSSITMPAATTSVPITFPSGYLTGNGGAVLGGEGICAAEKCGGGYWVLTTLKTSSANFIVVYTLTTAGLVSNNTAYQLPASVTPTRDFACSIKISPNGNKLVYSNYFNDSCILDFNKFTGVISNPIIIPKTYGVCFSPDSNLLYMDDSGDTNNSGAAVKLYQYNMLSNNILGTRVMIDNMIGPGTDIQQGPDNKLYRSIFGKNNLAIIHSPNSLMSPNNLNECRYAPDGVITNVSVATGGLPNFVTTKLTTAHPSTASISSYPSSCYVYKFVPNTCGSSFNWNFGDTASGASNTSTLTIPSHTFTADGTYTVTLRNSSNVIIATTTVTIGFTAPTITGTSTICTYGNRISNNSVSLQAGQSIVWSITSGTGTISGWNNQADVTVNWSATSPGGTISATITNASGCTRTVTKNITQTDTNCAFALPTNLCVNQTIPDMRVYLHNVPTNGTFNGDTVSGYALNELNDITPGPITISYTFMNGSTSVTIYSTSTVEMPIAPTISGSTGTHVTAPNNTTTNTTTIPSGYTASWSITSGTGTITSGGTAATVNATWTALPGQLTLTLTNTATGCSYSTNETIYNLTSCDCLTTQYFTYTRSGGTVTLTILNTNPNCPGNSGAKFQYGDVTYPYGGTGATVHTYTTPGTYTISMHPCIADYHDGCYCSATGTSQTVTIPAGCKGCPFGKQNLSSGITLFPNPASSVLNYVIDLPNSNSFETVVKTIDGREILRKKWNLTDGQRELQLELPNNISDGMLFVELISEEVRETRTILIKK